MSNKNIDVLIHINDQFNNQEYSEISERIHNSTGVISVCRNDHTPKFLSVVYNGSRVRATNILSMVRSLGYEASLVGM